MKNEMITTLWIAYSHWKPSTPADLELKTVLENFFLAAYQYPRGSIEPQIAELRKVFSTWQASNNSGRELYAKLEKAFEDERGDERLVVTLRKHVTSLKTPVGTVAIAMDGPLDNHETQVNRPRKAEEVIFWIIKHLKNGTPVCVRRHRPPQQ